MDRYTNEQEGAVGGGPDATTTMPVGARYSNTAEKEEAESETIDGAQSAAFDSIAADALAAQVLAAEENEMTDALAAHALAVDAQQALVIDDNNNLPWPLAETPMTSVARHKLPATPATSAAVATSLGGVGVSQSPKPMELAPGGLARQPEPVSQKFYNSLQQHRTPQIPPQFVVAGGRGQQQHHHHQDREEPLLSAEQSPASETAGQQAPSIASLFSKWLGECAWPGMGLFSESYLLFSVGTLKPIWELLFPNCFDGDECGPRVLNSIAYSVVVGVICGMIFVGYKANRIGRRNGSIFTATLMTIGAIGLCWSSLVLVQHVEYMYKSMSFFLFIFGMGVGGEYPLSAASASEKAMQKLRENQAMAELEQLYHHPKQQHREKDSQCDSKTQDHQVSSANKERAFSSDEQRGSSIQLVFMMQGLGIFFNNIMLMALLVVTGQSRVDDSQNYDPQALLGIWRASYMIGAFLLLYVLLTRVIYLTESEVWAEDKQRRDLIVRGIYIDPRGGDGDGVTSHQEAMLSGTGAAVAGESSHHVPNGRLGQEGFINADFPFPAIIPFSSSVSSLSYPSVVFNHFHEEAMLRQVPSTDAQDDLRSSPTWLLLRNFGVRLFGASTCWLLWDIAFYGNKLFQSSFLLALTGEETTLFEYAAAAALNSFVAMLGYIAAALVVDHPHVGRVRMQQWGFLLTGGLFVACGFMFNHLDSVGLVLLYLASSFFGQLGPNCTTFLIPAEIFPTEMRTMCHGICAASGKLGALMAAILFNRISDVDMFLVSGYASFGALIVTFWAIPETLGLDLYEIDRKWIMILEGRKGEYIGAANDPKHLSFYERSKLGLQY